MTQNRESMVNTIWNAGRRVLVPMIRYASVILLSLSIILCTIASAKGAPIALELIKHGFPLFAIGTGFVGLLVLPKNEKPLVLILMIVAAMITKAV